MGQAKRLWALLALIGFLGPASARPPESKLKHAPPPRSVIAFKLGPANPDPLDTPIVWLHVEWADIRDAVKKLLPRGAQMDPHVNGSVSLILHKGTVGQALYQMLRQVRATYEVRGSTVSIFDLEAFVSGAEDTSGDPLQTRRVTMEGFNFDVRDALRTIMKLSDLSYSIAPEVQGSVTFAFHDAPLAQVLRDLLNPVNATYRVEAGVIEIVMRERPGP